ncbi:tyrosine/serine protein phosphatase [Colletotrichum tofieldiae]|nr:tyrosine/serine protein phosphatase [Colletotrichum tofieldiae]
MDNSGITSVLNFRDVGSTVNKFLGRRKRLREELGIKAVIDLRTKTEHVKQAKKREADLQVPTLLQSNAALAEPVQISGLKYHEIKITGGSFEWFLALRVFLDPSTTPALVHCTQGKDRTGLIVTLVLMTLDVPLEAIEYDYMLTSGALESEREKRLAEIREIGLTDDWFEAAPDMIVRTARHIEELYGGSQGTWTKSGSTRMIARGSERYFYTDLDPVMSG